MHDDRLNIFRLLIFATRFRFMKPSARALWAGQGADRRSLSAVVDSIPI